MKRLTFTILISMLAICTLLISNAEATTYHLDTYTYYFVDGEVDAWDEPQNFNWVVDDGSDDVVRIAYVTIYYYLTKEDGTVCLDKRLKYSTLTINGEFISYTPTWKHYDDCDD